MKIRNATIKDKKDITNLYCELYPDRKIKKLLSIEKTKFKSFILVAEVGKQIVGFIWANFVQYGFSKFGYIEELFVKKEFRNKGIGRSLVKAIMKKFKDLKVAAVFVTTEKENKEVISLYKKLSFKLSKGPWFYWNPKEDLPK